MKHIKLIILGCVLFTHFCLNAQKDSLAKKEGLVWYTDIMKANEASKATNKPLFALFTGSDWCVWCKKLHNEVFIKPEFIQWAKKNVILVELDFPRTKTLSPELTQQNMSLQQTFRVQGFPTVWVFFLNKTADGKSFNIESLGSLGYPQDPEKGKEEVKFLKDANAVLANGKK